MVQPKLTAQDKKWQVEDDARTLAYAEEIKSDPVRVRKATKAAASMAKEKEKEAQAMKRVSKKTPTRKSTGKKAPARRSKRK